MVVVAIDKTCYLLTKNCSLIYHYQVVFSPKYALHYYRAERSVKELWIVLSSGLNIDLVVPIAFTTTNPEELLQKTGEREGTDKGRHDMITRLIMPGRGWGTADSTATIVTPPSPSPPSITTTLPPPPTLPPMTIPSPSGSTHGLEGHICGPARLPQHHRASVRVQAIPPKAAEAVRRGRSLLS